MVGPTRRGKGTKTMILTDGHGVPLGVDTESASRNECVLVERLLDRAILPGDPAGRRSAAADLRSGRRQRQAAGRLGRPRGRTDLSAPAGPQAAEASGRASTSPRQAAVDGRADDRLAAQLPADRRPLGDVRLPLRKLRPDRLPPDHLEEVLRPPLERVMHLVRVECVSAGCR